MLKITVDTNFLIDYENKSTHLPALDALYQAHNLGRIELRVPAISASEIQNRHLPIANYSEFTEFLAFVGLGNIVTVPPIGMWNLTFWDHGLWCDDSMEELDNKIHAVLFPEIPIRYADHCKALGIPSDTQPFEKKWRNAKCDVQMMWCHIWHGGDVFVTRDGNFFKPTKLPKLYELGAKSVASPDDVLGIIQ